MIQAAYKLVDIKSGYDGKVVLDIDNLVIEKNIIAALVGPNGAGKSTLLNLLAFMAVPLEGQISFMDQYVDTNRINSRRRKVGYVHQNPYLLRGSVFENIEVGLKFHGVPREIRYVKVMEIMEFLRIDNLAQRFVHNLSGGEAQKVAIGRMLVLDPEVLLFDEPFTYLDRRFVAELEDLVIALKTDRSKTVVFSTHNQLQAQAIADRVFSLVNGKVITASLSNLFKGIIDDGNSTFNTGNLDINIPETARTGHHLSIDPAQIVLSRKKLDSSMQNSFEGRITGMFDENGQIRVIVKSNEKFQVLITRVALSKLALTVGDRVWVSFKSSAVQVF